MRVEFTPHGRYLDFDVSKCIIKVQRKKKRKKRETINLKLTEGGSVTVANGDGRSQNNQHDGENPQSLTREESRQG